MRPDRDLRRALAALIALGLATTAIAALRDGAALVWPAAAAAALLVLAGLKAEIILARYLALRVAPAWLRGFRGAVVLLIAILYALWLVPLLGG
jgi:hypothetical protein